MKYGFVMPPMDPCATVDFAYEAEQVGWDGFFVLEGMWTTDAWVCLTGAAMRTKQIH